MAMNDIVYVAEEEGTNPRQGLEAWRLDPNDRVLLHVSVGQRLHH